jgi:hypothetical protein
MSLVILLIQHASHLQALVFPLQALVFPWCSFLVLYGAGLLGGVAILPYMTVFVRAKVSDPRIIRQQLLLQFLQNAIVLGLSIFFGLKGARATGLARSVTDCWREGLPGFWRVGPGCVLIGLLAAGAILLVDYFVLMPRLPSLREALRPLTGTKMSYKILAAIYGGVAEELIMRLGLFTLLVWLAQASLSRTSPSTAILWAVNFTVAVVFAAGHLPAMAALARLTPLITARVLLLNFPLSLLFGYVYFTFGLEAAIVIHAVTSLTIQLASSSGISS